MRRIVSLCALAVLASPVFAEVTIPTTGCDISAYIQAAIVALGGVAAVAVGGYFAFFLIKKGLRWANKAALVVATLLIANSASAAEAVTIPSTPCDIGAYIQAAIVALGGVAAVAVGGYFAFFLIKKGLRWANKAA